MLEFKIFDYQLKSKYYKEKPVYVEGNYKMLDNGNGYSGNPNHYKIRN